MAGDMSGVIFESLWKRVNYEVSKPQREQVRKFLSLHYRLDSTICQTKKLCGVVGVILALALIIFISQTIPQINIVFPLNVVAGTGITFGICYGLWRLLVRVRHIEKMRRELAKLNKNKVVITIVQRLKTSGRTN